MTFTMVVGSCPLHFVGYLSFCLKISLQTIWHIIKLRFLYSLDFL
jgi:hypothetical protein